MPGLSRPRHWPEYLREKPALLSPFQVPALPFYSAFNWMLAHVNMSPVPALFGDGPITTFLTARLNSDWLRSLGPIPFRPISYSPPKRTLPRHAQDSNWSLSCHSYLSSPYPRRSRSPPGGSLVSPQVDRPHVPPTLTSWISHWLLKPRGRPIWADTRHATRPYTPQRGTGSSHWVGCPPFSRKSRLSPSLIGRGGR